MIQRIVQITLILLFITYVIWWITHGGINISFYSKKYFTQPIKHTLWKELFDASSMPHFLQDVTRLAPVGPPLTPILNENDQPEATSSDQN